MANNNNNNNALINGSDKPFKANFGTKSIKLLKSGTRPTDQHCNLCGAGPT